MPGFRTRLAAANIAAGGLVAHPTEGVYGLACDPDNRAALVRLLTVKDRSRSKGLILIGSEWSQLERYCAPLAETTLADIQTQWPGPITFVLPASAATDPLICGASGSVAVRVTAHPLSRELCNACGHALVSTSANRSGRAPPRSAHGVRLQLGTSVDLVLAGALGGRTAPTPIRDALSGRVLRPG